LKQENKQEGALGTMDKECKVVLADDSAFARKVITSYLDKTEFKVVAACENGRAAVEAFKSATPDIVMLDVIMPDMTGADALKAIMQLNPKAKVLMVSSLGTESMVTDCLSIGARGFVQKPTNRDTLLGLLRQVAAE
jgi:two-component system, chemotaxis family, chemotaxis protein CheY